MEESAQRREDNLDDPRMHPAEMENVIYFPHRDARRKQNPKQTHRSGNRHRHICEIRNAPRIEDGASHQRENRYFSKRSVTINF